MIQIFRNFGHLKLKSVTRLSSFVMSRMSSPPVSLSPTLLPNFLHYRLVVDSLYCGFCAQCASCGLRFERKENYRNHLDWHFIYNSLRSRKNWMPRAQGWWPSLSNKEEKCLDGPTRKKTKVDLELAKRVAVVAAGEPNKCCSVCNEAFETYWDEDRDEWMYRNAVKVGENILHYTCSVT